MKRAVCLGGDVARESRWSPAQLSLRINGWHARAWVGMLAGLCAGVFAPQAAFAHHGTSVTRVGGEEGVKRLERAGWLAEEEEASARLRFAANYVTRLYDRVLQGTEPYPEGGLGSVLVQRLDWGARLDLKDGLGLDMLLPTGLVSARPAQAATQRELGLGDLRLGVGFELAKPLSLPRGISVSPHISASLPTGHYQEQSQLSISELQAGPGGSLGYALYDTRASLGAGIISLAGGLSLALSFDSGVSLGASGLFSAPLMRTQDDILWGNEFEAGLNVGLPLWEELLLMIAELKYRDQGAVSVPFEAQEGANTGSELGLDYESVGGSEELVLGLGVGVYVSSKVRCFVGGELPIWQRTAQIQLVESLAMRTGCSLGFGL